MRSYLSYNDDLHKTQTNAIAFYTLQSVAACISNVVDGTVYLVSTEA